MAKTVTVTKSKAATKAANDKKTRVTKPKADKADKPKREPTAYQIFCKANMKAWNDANPGRSKEAMSQMALLWKDAPENPNRGAGPKARKPKAPKEPKEPKEKAPRKKAAAKKAATDQEEEEEDQVKESSDPMDDDDDEAVGQESDD